MKQIYPITVLVLVAITVCLSVIGVRPPASTKSQVEVKVQANGATPQPAAAVFASGQ